MKIREAKEEDKQLWDSFIDAQEGAFNNYFDCRYLGLNIVQLLVESDQSNLICLCRLDLEYRAFYTTIRMSGILFTKEETEDKKYQITQELLKYIENNYSKRCSTFVIEEQTKQGSETNINPNKAFLDFKFRLRKGLGPNLPCSHVLPLKAPFEEYIWKGLFSQDLRKALNKVEKMRVKVIQDRKLKYLENYLDMSEANYKRLGVPITSRAGKINECNTFKDKTKLFVALLDDKPVVILKCYYTFSTCYLSGVGSYTKGTDDINKYCYKVAIEDACNNGYKYADFGASSTEGLAKLKDRFKFIRVPILTYEKRYSFHRVMLELTPALVKICFHNQKYIWKYRLNILDKIVRW